MSILHDLKHPKHSESEETRHAGGTSEAEVDREKREARSSMKKRLASIGAEERRKASRAISDMLMSLPEMKNAAFVFCFISIQQEPDTMPIIEALLDSGKTVCIPHCEKNGIMDARILTGTDALRPTPPFGIPELPDSARTLEPERIDFAVVPGLAFDRTGGRLGRGAGYYDRYLAKCRAVKCGICFEPMLFAEIPKGSNDVPMDMIVTDQSLLRLGRTEGKNA